MSNEHNGQVAGGIERLQTRLSDASLSSRRSFLKRSAAAGAGALALSIGGSNAALAADADDDDVSDLDVLNYALTLEHLEYAFYRDALDRFDEANFMRSKSLRGYGDRVRGNVYDYFGDIRDHEETHVETLTAVITDLGGDPVAEADYDFGIDSVDEFIAIAAVLENTGVSAYDGAISLIDNGDLQTAGATIATVEARHAAYLNQLNGDSPFPVAFDDPKSMEEVLDAAGGFIVG